MAGWFRAFPMDPLDKIIDATLPEPLGRAITAIPGETVGLQFAFAAEDATDYDRLEAAVRVRTSLGETRIALVESVPCALPAYPDHDSHYLAVAPTSLPDHLVPFGGSVDTRARFLPNYWQSIYVDVDVPTEARAGLHSVTVEFFDREGVVRASTEASVSVADTFVLSTLPAFPHAQWLHVDALAVAAGTEMWSEVHWAAIDDAVTRMVSHGITVLFTPILTPALDTAVGGERLTAQLVGVIETPRGYRFDFSLLDRWVGMAERHGIAQLELAPLYTQWGARHAPKVVVETADGVLRRFGWDTDAGGAEYSTFVTMFVRAVTLWLDESGWAEKYFFHVSDEPGVEHREAYRAAVRTVRSATDAVIRDATIDLGLVRDGAIDHPIAGLEVLADFVAHGSEDTWAFTSCAHHVDLPNVFIALSGVRTRMTGVQLYLGGATGFLRWGFNFWFSQHAGRFIDPRQNTDAGLAFPSGDSFLVYPGVDGLEESLRLKYLREAMIDVRMLLALEQRIGRAPAVRLVQTVAGGISLNAYPDGAVFFTDLRRAIIEASESRPNVR